MCWWTVQRCYFWMDTKRWIWWHISSPAVRPIAEHKGKEPVSLAMDPSPSAIEMPVLTFLTVVVSKAAIVWILTLLYVLGYPRAHCALYFQCSQYILYLAFNSIHSAWMILNFRILFKTMVTEWIVSGQELFKMTMYAHWINKRAGDGRWYFSTVPSWIPVYRSSGKQQLL